ncbi:MAG: hypothetical protein EOS72_07225 [Mesorhizobium sp.]|uniref:hypothetical protein n=1 Tax=Mesorhizobium sp. TaxID=1871066 RepID=UPI000FE786FF|nr:hypothetical protein [Mesorhizobium sp.]RWC90643.1 MAG: hypothetical protein EOS72_07225 [Mesorhizobium sp.]
MGEKPSADFDGLLARIEAVAQDVRDELSRNLLYAYVACLNPSQLVDAIQRCLGADQVVLKAYRTRLLRLGRQGEANAEIDSLGADLITRQESDARIRVRIDALLSAIFPFLSPVTRRAALDRWMNKGTRGTAKRWLKAMDRDDLLFDLDAVVSEWQHSRDPLAMKIFTHHASPETLAHHMREIATEGAPGWLVSKAAIKVGEFPKGEWQIIRERFPATYAYLCAMLNRTLSDEDALAIIEETSNGPFGERGLAIWALGQMGMVDALDRVNDRHDELIAQEMSSLASR